MLKSALMSGSASSASTEGRAGASMEQVRARGSCVRARRDARGRCDPPSSRAADVTAPQVCTEFLVRAANIVLRARVDEEPAPARAGAAPRRASWVRLQPPPPERTCAAVHLNRRSYYYPPPTANRPLQTRFGLEQEDLPSAQPALERWRGARGVGLPLVLEVWLRPRGGAAGAPTLLERWVLRVAPAAAAAAAAPLQGGGAARASPRAVHRRLTLLLRALLAQAARLPAARLARAARARGRDAPPFELVYALHSSLPPAPRGVGLTSASSSFAGFVAFDFAPVEAADGAVRVGVEYAPAGAVRVAPPGAGGAAAPRGASARVIPDYLGASPAGRGGSGGWGPPLSPAPSAPPALGGRRAWASAARPRLSGASLSSAASEPPSPPPAALEVPFGSAPAAAAAQEPSGRAIASPRPARPPSPPAEAGGGSPPSGAGRPTSQPVSIPGAALLPAARCLRSWGDLNALGAAAAAAPAGAKPLSAPAVSHLPTAAPAVGAAARPSAATAACSPPRGAGAASSAGGSSAGAPPPPSLPPSLPRPSPASSSPDLPFAFTPRSPSGVARLSPGPPTPSPGSTPRAAAAASGSAAAAVAAGGRIALLRTSPSAEGGSPAARVGYSVSPLGSLPLDSILYGASTPRAPPPLSPAPRAAGGLSAALGGGRPAPAAAPPPALLAFRSAPLPPTAPPPRAAAAAAACGLGANFELAFARPQPRRAAAPRADGSDSSSGSSGDARGGGGGGGGGGSGCGLAAALAADSTAAAVGAFAALAAGAAPLGGAPPRPLAAGLAQLAELTARLAERGVEAP